MFDNLKAMGAIAGLLKNQDKLKAAVERARRTLADTRLTGEAGGGAVRVIVAGDMRVLSVEVSPALAGGFADAESRRMAETLIADAVNDGLRRAQAAAAEIIGKEARELGLPDLPAGLGGLGGLLP